MLVFCHITGGGLGGEKYQTNSTEYNNILYHASWQTG